MSFIKVLDLRFDQRLAIIKRGLVSLQANVSILMVGVGSRSMSLIVVPRHIS